MARSFLSKAIGSGFDRDLREMNKELRKMTQTGVSGYAVPAPYRPAKLKPHHIETRSFIDGIIAQHAAMLAQKKKQTTFADEYGVMLVDRGWTKAMNYFAENVIWPSLNTYKARRYWTGDLRFNVYAMIEERIADIQTANAFAPNMHPSDYERLCGQILSDAGWQVQITQYTADQGTDVFATKDGVSLVLQCKLYSKPVGNKAVQEAVGAKGYMNAHHAAVVSNANYTPAARQLATANNVALLHHDGLAAYSQSISSNAWPATPPGAISIMPPPTTRL